MTTRRRLGVTPWQARSPGGRELLEQARFAERLGFHSFWLPESHFFRGARPSPLMELSAIAGCTERLRLGTSSLLLPIRHPLSVAEDVAVLDQLSGGRLILGLGRGFRPDLFAAFDIDPSTKRSLFEANLERMLAAWSGEALGQAGESGRPIRLQPRPLQQPHPPLWLAAFGPKALAQAGRLGLPYLASPLETFSRVQENWTLVRQAGRERSENSQGSQSVDHGAVPLMRTAFVSERRERLDTARRLLAEEFAQWRTARQGVAGSERNEPMHGDAAAAVGSRALVGTPSEVHEQLQHWEREIGVTHWILRPGPLEVDSSWHEESLRCLADLH